jgi:hypothetical protein
VQRILKEAEESGNMNIVNAVTYSSNLPSSLKRVNRSALTYALENATLPVIKALMDAGAYTDITDSEGNDLYYYLDKNNFVDLSLEEIIIAPLEEIKPSFDCALASTNQEKAICSNDGLAVYDKHMSDLYKAVRQGQDDDIKVLQRRWLKELKQTCSMTDSTQLNSCLKSQYRTRIQYLNNLIDNNLSR